MVGQRRFAPLIAVLAIALGAIWIRLFQVQVAEHAVWAREARGLLKSSAVVPYHRGRILDAKGRAIVRDEGVYQVALEYRAFRRGSPLGQVAHAWSSLASRPVSLADALADLQPLALALVELSPADLDGLARGSGIERLGVAQSADPERDLCSQRASDLRFYVGELLGLRRTDWAALRKWRDEPEWSRPFLELAARLDQPADLAAATSERRARLAAELAAVPEDLARLADLVERDEAAVRTRARSDEPGSPIDALIGDLERWRRLVDDEMADELFLQAAGFPAGRLSAQALAAVDLGWIARLLRWDAPRLAEWVVSRRPRWTAWLAEQGIPRILVGVELEDERDLRPERLLDELARLYARPDPGRLVGAERGGWRDIDDLAVLSELDDLFDDVHPEVPRRVLPFEDPELRGADAGGDPWLLAGAVLAGDAPGDAKGATKAADLWRRLAEDQRWSDEEGRAELGRVLADWEGRLLAAADAAILGPARAAGGRLALAPGRLEHAREREHFILRDRSSRPFLVARRPSDDLVHLLTRYDDRYRGFSVRDTTRRVALELEEDGTTSLGALIGRVRLPDLRDLLAQRERERELLDLEQKLARSASEERRIVELTAELIRDDEVQGGFGIEGFFDPELRGRNGYRETGGLQEREEGGEDGLYQAPVDGKDVVLTIDLDLQRAAQWTLANPELDPGEPHPDRVWFENPVGALVLITPDGAVLAAASEPTRPHEPPRHRLAQRANPIDRTLRRPTHNPPGSVFKPFVAAWALDRLGLDPARRFECGMLEDGTPGYGTMHCTAHHGSVDLHEALSASCNAYFAHLGEEVYGAADVAAMARTFGFGQPTGVLSLGDGKPAEGRHGLREDASLRSDLDRVLERQSQRMMATNGLMAIEATPMQVARATAGLATGRLPDLRLVRSIGGEALPARAEPIAIDPANLAIVVRAMEAVVDEPQGSANGKGLDRASLGFSLALKTGSADFRAFEEPEDDPRFGTPGWREGRVRKHTWIAGWFPAEQPRAVLVVYLHDVAETASRSAVYVARQFLKTQAVKDWLAAQTESAAQQPAGGEQ